MRLTRSPVLVQVGPVRGIGLSSCVLLLAGCPASEAPRVELPVVVDSSGLSTAVTDLGFGVAFEQARVTVADLRFTTAGEVHESHPSDGGAQLLGRLMEAFLPSAHAHPGHSQGGEVIGELPGTFVIDFAGEDGRELGLATLITGDYTAINFVFGRAGVDEVAQTDELFGHTALLRGIATPAQGDAVAFTVVIDSPLDRELVGAPFEATVDELGTFEIGLRMLGSDPQEGDHLFDGIDFAALDELDGAQDGVLLLVDPETLNPPPPAALADAYFQIRREFQTHDLFDAVVREP
jgi:hypothetical protein